MSIPPEIYTLLQQVSDGVQQLEADIRPLQASLATMQVPSQAFTDAVANRDSFPTLLTESHDLIRQSSRYLIPRAHDIELCIDSEYALSRSINLSTLFPDQIIRLDELNFVTVRQSAVAIPRTDRVPPCQKTGLDQLDLDIPMDLKFSSSPDISTFIAVISTQCFLTLGSSPWSSSFLTQSSRSPYLCEDQTLDRRLKPQIQEQLRIQAARTTVSEPLTTDALYRLNLNPLFFAQTTLLKRIHFYGNTAAIDRGRIDPMPDLPTGFSLGLKIHSSVLAYRITQYARQQGANAIERFVLDAPSQRVTFTVYREDSGGQSGFGYSISVVVRSRVDMTMQLTNIAADTVSLQISQRGDPYIDVSTDIQVFGKSIPGLDDLANAIIARIAASLARGHANFAYNETIVWPGAAALKPQITPSALVLFAKMS